MYAYAAYHNKSMFMSMYIRCTTGMLLLIHLQGCSAVTLIPQLYEAAIIATQPSPSGAIFHEISELLSDPDEEENTNEP